MVAKEVIKVLFLIYDYEAGYYHTGRDFAPGEMEAAKAYARYWKQKNQARRWRLTSPEHNPEPVFNEEFEETFDGFIASEPTLVRLVTYTEVLDY